MKKEVFSTGIRLNEPESFLLVEPFYRSGWHVAPCGQNRGVLDVTIRDVGCYTTVGQTKTCDRRKIFFNGKADNVILHGIGGCNQIGQSAAALPNEYYYTYLESQNKTILAVKA